MCNSSTRARGRRIAVSCLVYIVSSRSSLGYRVIFCFIKQLPSPALLSKWAQTYVHLPSTGINGKAGVAVSICEYTCVK